MIEILTLDEGPIHEIDYRFARHGGGIGVGALPILTGTVDRLPEAIDALIVTADLQGIGPCDDQVLLGELVAEKLHKLAAAGTIPDAGRTGVVLAGDFHVDRTLQSRGGGGDVRPIWRAFRDRFRWVAGIAGNHDRFGETADELIRFAREERIHYIDGRIAEIDGLTITGVGGIMGRTTKPFRRPPLEYLDLVGRLIHMEPDLLVLHEAPDHPELRLPGRSVLRERIEMGPPGLVAFGHCYWKRPLATLANGSQVLNVDSRVVVLRGAER